MQGKKLNKQLLLKLLTLMFMIIMDIQIVNNCILKYKTIKMYLKKKLSNYINNIDLKSFAK